jgi:hypothetical protein
MLYLYGINVKTKNMKFLDFGKQIEEMTETCVAEIKSLLRNSGKVEWGNDDFESGNCPGVCTDLGNCEVTKVYSKDDKFWVDYTSNDGVVDTRELDEFLLNDLNGLYEAVYNKVMEGKTEDSTQSSVNTNYEETDESKAFLVKLEALMKDHGHVMDEDDKESATFYFHYHNAEPSAAAERISAEMGLPDYREVLKLL